MLLVVTHTVAYSKLTNSRASTTDRDLCPVQSGFVRAVYKKNYLGSSRVTSSYLPHCCTFASFIRLWQLFGVFVASVSVS